MSARGRYIFLLFIFYGLCGLLGGVAPARATSVGGAISSAKGAVSSVTGAVSAAQDAANKVTQQLQNNAKEAVTGVVGNVLSGTVVSDALSSVGLNSTVLTSLKLDASQLTSQLTSQITSQITGPLTEALVGSGLIDLKSLPDLKLPGVGGGCYKYGMGTCVTMIATTLWWKGDPPLAPDMQKYVLQDIYTESIIGDFWKKQFKPALQDMTAQNAAVETQLRASQGKMADAANQNAAIREVQGRTAQAYKDYTPSDALCRFGTNVRSLAAAEGKAETTQKVLAKIIQDRQLGTRGNAASGGDAADRKSRLTMFKSVYCDPADNGGLLIKQGICDPGKRNAGRLNRDINFGRTIAGRNTLDLDFGSAAASADAQDVIALAHNLYGHKTMSRMTDAMASDPSGQMGTKEKYMQLRNLVAIRNVAASAYTRAAAMRAKGGGAGANFMRNMAKEMGFSDREATTYLDSGTGAPSYNAQMEALTKLFYLSPNFYTNLLDKPANVERQVAAMQAIGLMQDRDISDVTAQQELMLSLFLEMKTRAAQREVLRLYGETGVTGVRR